MLWGIPVGLRPPSIPQSIANSKVLNNCLILPFGTNIGGSGVNEENQFYLRKEDFLLFIQTV